MVRRLLIPSPRPGLHEFTDALDGLVRESGVHEGLCTVFVQHTSASLVIQENADPSAKRDLEAFLARLAPEGDPATRTSPRAATTCPRTCARR